MGEKANEKTGKTFHFYSHSYRDSALYKQSTDNGKIWRFSQKSEAPLHQKA